MLGMIYNEDKEIPALRQVNLFCKPHRIDIITLWKNTMNC